MKRVGVSVAAITLVASAIAADDYPKTTPDGLTLVEDEQDVVLYWRDDVGLEAYSKVRILDCAVEFQENWRRDYNRNTVGLGNRVSVEDMDNIKSSLATTLMTVFAEELTESGYDIVDSVGSDVLLLRPAIMNLDVNVPRGPISTVDYSVASSGGSLTFYMEIYDSATVSKIGFVIDEANLQDNRLYTGSARAAARSEASHLMRSWARS